MVIRKKKFFPFTLPNFFVPTLEHCLSLDYSTARNYQDPHPPASPLSNIHQEMTNLLNSYIYLLLIYSTFNYHAQVAYLSILELI